MARMSRMSRRGYRGPRGGSRNPRGRARVKGTNPRRSFGRNTRGISSRNFGRNTAIGRRGPGRRPANTGRTSQGMRSNLGRRSLIGQNMITDDGFIQSGTYFTEDNYARTAVIYNQAFQNQIGFDSHGYGGLTGYYKEYCAGASCQEIEKASNDG